MTPLHETEVDGVRCFWVESGRPTLVGSLLFRQGTADEPFHESGWLHAIEHLALHGRGGGALSVNGSVSPLVTSFDSHGPAAAVSAHLASVSAWLSEPSFTELDRERGVLRAESAVRENPVSRAMTWRYGARGPGLSGLAEPGLGRATAELLRSRAHLVFNRNNAILVLDGPPPSDLRLTLPSGSFRPPRDAVPCDDVLPAAYVENGGLALSGLVERSAAATLVPGLVQRALKESLRDGAGAAYAPWAHYEAVDRTHAVVFAGSDVSTELMPTLVPTTLDLVARLRDRGPDPAHVAEHVEAMAQGLSDPYSVAAVAFRAAHAVFEGRRPQTHDEILDEVRSLSAEEVAHSLTSFCATLLLGVPGPAQWHDELPMLRQPLTARVDGKRFRHRNWPATAATLTVSPETIQLGEGDTVTSISVPRVVGMYAFADGRRTVTCEDGWSIAVDPTEWHRGPSAISLLDNVISAELQVPHPTPHNAEHLPRMSWMRRWWLGFRRVLRSRQAAIAALVILGGAFVAAVVFGYVPGVVAAGVFVYSVVKELRAQRRPPSAPELHDNEDLPRSL